MIVRRMPVTRFLDRLIDDVNSELGQATTNGDANSFSLALDVHEDEHQYEVKASLPGVKPDDIDVQLEDGVLTISAETRFEKKEETARTLIQERRYGRYTRSLRFPQAVNTDNIEADYVDGVLTVIVPKAEESKPQKIAVKKA